MSQGLSRQFNCRMDPLLDDALKYYAQARGMTLAEAVRTILRMHLEHCIEEPAGTS
jgi:predicted HicB family RNase H-like nuclease